MQEETKTQLGKIRSEKKSKQLNCHTAQNLLWVGWHQQATIYLQQSNPRTWGPRQFLPPKKGSQTTQLSLSKIHSSQGSCQSGTSFHSGTPQLLCPRRSWTVLAMTPTLPTVCCVLTGDCVWTVLNPCKQHGGLQMLHYVSSAVFGTRRNICVWGRVDQLYVTNVISSPYIHEESAALKSKPKEEQFICHRTIIPLFGNDISGQWSAYPTFNACTLKVVIKENLGSLVRLLLCWNAHILSLC